MSNLSIAAPNNGIVPGGLMNQNHLDALALEIDKTRPPEFSDDALALRFAERNAQSMRYVAALGRWYIWDGARWHLDETLIARHRARKICREAAAECNQLKIAKLIASAKTVAAVERLAQADRRLAATVDQWDADPWVLNTPGGIIDLRSGEIRKHDPLAFLTKITGTGPDDKQPTPTWRSFLKRIIGGHSEVIDYLKRVAGYSLTGSTQEHALFFCYGLGANGKTTFLNAIAAAVGDYHKTAPIETFTATNHDQHPTDIAGLRGARLVTAIETEEGRRWAESRIKALTGGDKITARFMRQDFFEYTPQFKLIIAGNHKPGLRAVDEAMRRRFNLIPFTVTIPPEVRDETLAEKLKAELPGILAWMIDGCIDWLERGLAPPEAVTSATAEYLKAEDLVGAWINDCAERKEGWSESAGDLFASWKQWAERAGEQVGTQRAFSRKLEQQGILKGDHARTGATYVGLRLIEAPRMSV